MKSEYKLGTMLTYYWQRKEVVSVEQLKVGVIGCGNVSKVHFAAVAANPQAQLVAACDIKPNRAAAYGAEYQVPDFTDYKDVLDLEPDIIHICTPHHTHADICIDACDRGIHVLTEKPMAVSLHDADRMRTAAERNGTYLGVIFQNRYNAASIAVKKAVDEGRLGKVYGTRMFVTWYRPDEYYSRSDWKGTWDMEGGGVLIDQAIHTIDLMQWIVGSIDSLEASMDNRTHDLIDVEDVAEATVYFKNGAIGSLYAVNYYTYDADVFLEVHGQYGIARIEKDAAMIKLKGQEPEIVRPPEENSAPGKSYWGASHKTQIAQFYESVLNGTPVDIDGAEGRTALEIVRSIYYSGGHNSCKVEFPFREPAGFQPASLTR